MIRSLIHAVKRQLHLPDRAQQLGLAVAATACSGLPLLNRVGILETLALLGVTVLAGFAVWSSTRGGETGAGSGSSAAASGHADGEVQEEPLPALLTGVLPVWLTHVGSVKSQTEEAITQLSISFASIAEQFEAAGFKVARASANGGDDTTMSLLTLCERQLSPMISAMTRILDSKGALVDSVANLAVVTAELQDMTHAVSGIAAQTNMLAINAAIEAAHAGDTGRGFAVIAKEIRQLSNASAKTGKLISERMANVKALMQSTVAAAGRASASDKVAIELSTHVVQDVLAHVRELGVEADKMRGQGNIIRADVENLLVNLQFQDRVSQIIGVIDGDIRRLQGVVASDQAVPDRRDWLSQLHSNYTMDDQREAHQVPGHARKSAAGQSEVSFF